MTITNTGRRLALVGLLALVAALIPLSGASAAHLTGVTQLTADDNVGAAIAWSNPAGFPSGGIDSGARDPQYVLIGRDNIFPDNLASGALQGANGPLLLTDTDELDQDVIDEIERLGVDQAIILGEFEAISQDVEDELNELLTDVTRLGGETRIETAIEITSANASDDVDVDADGDTADGTDSSTAILARAFDSSGGSSSAAFADSLAAGGWAADEGYGVLLTQTEVLTESTADYLASGEIDDVIIVGGTQAVSAAVEAEVRALGLDVRRVGGDNRADTAVMIAEERDGGDGIILVEGFMENAWASGFPAAATSALEDYPIVLSNGEGLPPETEEYLQDFDGGLMTGPGTGTDTGTGTNDGIRADLVCGPLMPGAGEEGAQENVTEDLAPACERAAALLGQDGPITGPGVVRSCIEDLETFTAAPELTGVEVDATDRTIVRYSFDEAIPGQALRSRPVDPIDPTQGVQFVNFRLYAANGTVAFPTEARIAGDTVIARFGSGNFVASASRAGVSYDALTNDQGISSTEAHCALNPTAQAPRGQQSFLQLTNVGNFRLSDIIVGGRQDVLVDFTFNRNPGPVTAEDFFLVGSNSALFPAQAIVTQPRPTDPANPTTSSFVVTVDFGDDAAQVPRSQLRRGVFVFGPNGGSDGILGTPDDLDGRSGILAEPFEGTNGGTVDPDLVEVTRLDQTRFEFRFDEAVSQADIDASRFFLFDSNGDTFVASAANRVTGSGATVVRAVFETPGNTVDDDRTNPSDSTAPVGAFVGDRAVRATDNTQSENLGFNRPDQVELIISTPVTPGVVPAGVTALPDLINLLVNQNVVTENFSVTYVFDQSFDTATAQNIRFSLFDAAGFEFAQFGTTCATTGVQCDSAGGTFSVTFSVDRGFTGSGEINNEAIAAAVSGGVETLHEPRTNNPPPPVVTEGYFGVNENR